MFLIDILENLDTVRETLGYVNPMTLKELCLSYTNDGTGLTTESIIHQAAPFVFSYDFPIFDENHRLELEEKIIRRYYFRRLCCEDVDEWKVRFDARLNEIMPYYNKMYESIGYLTDILEDVDYQRIIGEDTQKANSERTKSTQESNGETVSIGAENTSQDGSRSGTSEKKADGMSSDSSTSVVNGSANSVNKYSDTPQGELTGVVNGNYLTNATVQDDTTASTTKGQNSRIDGSTENVENSESSEVSGHTERQSSGNSKTNTVGSFDTDGVEQGNRNMTEHVKGKMYGGSKSKFVMEYRKAIINVDSEILGRLADLFLNVY